MSELSLILDKLKEVANWVEMILEYECSKSRNPAQELCEELKQLIAYREQPITSKLLMEIGFKENEAKTIVTYKIDNYTFLLYGHQDYTGRLLMVYHFDGEQDVAIMHNTKTIGQAMGLIDALKLEERNDG